MLKYKKGKCSTCGKKDYIVNSKFKLCKECNNNRLFEKKPKKEIKPTKKIVVKKITSKEAEFQKKLREVKLEKRELHITNGTYYCEGCGKAGEKLDCSHIISLRRRKDLGLEISNLRLLDSRCHTIWESRNIENMKLLHCFEEDKEYVKLNDPEWYHLLFE